MTFNQPTSHLLKLANCSTATTTRVYLAGFHHFSKAELIWLKSLLKSRQSCIVIEGDQISGIMGDSYHPDAVPANLINLLGYSPKSANNITKNPVSALLNAVYAQQGLPLRERAQLLSVEQPRSPIAERIFLFEASGADDEARAIELLELTAQYKKEKAS